MQVQEKGARKKLARSRKARTLLTIGPNDPNFDSLVLGIMKREKARAKRRAKTVPSASA